MKATTDSEGEVRYDVENKPGVSNLLSIMSALTDRPIEQLEKDYAGHGYGDFKKDLVEVTVDALRPIKENFNEIRNSQELIDALNQGAERANEISIRTLKRVRDAFGMGI